MTRGTISMRLLAAAVACAALGSSANAGLLPLSVSVIPENDNYRWTYALVLPTDMKLQSGNYFTIYDFRGYIAGGESMPAGWTLTPSLTGGTPDQLAPIDDPSLMNLTFKYDGPTIPSGQIGLGNFWAISEFGEKATSSFTAETNRTSDGLLDRNVTTTEAPKQPNVVDPGPSVPEPGTLLLAALGLPLLGLGRFVRRKLK